MLKEPVGKQDPYVAAHGGICAYTFHPDGTVDVEPLELAAGDAAAPATRTCCSSTPARRATRPRVLSDQDKRSRSGDEEMLENLHATKEMGRRSYELLRRGRPRGVRRADARALGEQAPALARDGAREHIDTLYTLARRSGAIGGKLVGAGGGGFLLVYARRPADTRQAMAAAGAQELLFDFEFGGAHASEYQSDAGCGSGSSVAA